MPIMITRPRIAVLMILAAMLVAIQGCGESHHTLSEKEWDQVMSMAAENTKAASELVQRDAESRRAWLSLHQDLQDERSEIDQQRDLLEEDRRAWDERERNDPIIAEAIGACGLLAACSLPLILIALLIGHCRRESADETVCEILVEDLTSASPRIGSNPSQVRRIEDDR